MKKTKLFIIFLWLILIFQMSYLAVSIRDYYMVQRNMKQVGVHNLAKVGEVEIVPATSSKSSLTWISGLTGEEGPARTNCAYLPGGFFSNVGIIEYPCDTKLTWDMFNSEQKKAEIDMIKSDIYNASEKAGINPATAMRIAFCESSYNPYNENPKTNAKGLYQFKDKTWEVYCVGDPFNYHDNLRCFMDIYPQNKGWWECK